MNMNELRASELEKLADDLQALMRDEDPWENRIGPSIAGSDTEHAGYEAVAEYARERAAWLRGGWWRYE